MKKSTAVAIARLLIRQNNEQIDLLKEIEDNKPSDFSEVQKLLAKTLGTSYIDILRPIFSKYPELKPDNYP